MNEAEEVAVIPENTESNKKNVFEFVTITVTVLTLVLTGFTAWSQLVENKKDRQLESIVAFRIKQLETVIDGISNYGYQSSNLYSLYFKRDKSSNIDSDFIEALSISKLETQQTLDKIMLNLDKNNQYYKEINKWVQDTTNASADPEDYRMAELFKLDDSDQPNIDNEIERIMRHISAVPPKPIEILKKYVDAEWELINKDL